MSWHDTCHNFDSRIEASAEDANFNDISFLLTQEDAEDSSGDTVFANKAILALVSPVFYSQFYGRLPVKVRPSKPIKIVDGTARGFKQMIKYIISPNSFRFKVNSAEEVFELCYFAHRYQIGSLVSLCRSFLGSYGQYSIWSRFKKEDALDILNWVVSNSQTAFPAEHALLVQACWKQIETNFYEIFPDGKVKNDQPLPEEDLMMKIFGNKSLNVEEGLVLSVALDYFDKLIDLEKGKGKEKGKSSTAFKKFKIDKESQWNEKFDKISSIIDLEKVSPKWASDILDKFQSKIPEKIVLSVMMKISSSWKQKTSFDEKIRKPDKTILKFEINNDESDDMFDENDHQSINVAGKEISIKFRINQNAIFRLDLEDSSFFYFDDFPLRDTFVYISFQNEADYEEVLEQVWKEKKLFAKKNTDITIRFKTYANSTEEVEMCKVEQFLYSDQDFQLEILELNGEPVANNSECLSILSSLEFIPIERNS